jgi:predicted aldo/keto reductase-like oxidoreductase
MQYRNFGKLDWKASALGFGCMRFPTSDGGRLSPNINEAEALRMVRHAIDSGVNYIDTAYPYHGGQSEIVVGKALKDGYREKVRLATKLPVWLIESEADFDRLLNEQLDKLQTSYIDFYLLHALSRSRWQDIVLKHNLLDRARAALADGRIRHLGFSFHDEYDAFEEIVNGSDLWSFCQIQYNYMDTEHPWSETGGKQGFGRGRHGAADGRQACRSSKRCSGSHGELSRAAICCGVGASVALGSAGGLCGPERHERLDSGGREPARC